MKSWISAFRLRTLPLSLSCIITGSFMAYFTGHFDWRIFISAMITTVFLQILSNLANDYGDAVKGIDDESRLGPERAIQSGKITPRQMKTAIFIFVLLSLVSGLILLKIAFGDIFSKNGITWLSVGIGAILAAIYYTVGSKPYGYRSLGDLFVFIFFGLIGVAGTFFLHTKFISTMTLVPAAAIGLLCMGVLNLNNMRDRVQDEVKGKITLAVRLGFERAKYYQYALIVLALVLVVVFTLMNYKGPVQWIFLLTSPLFLMIVANVQKIQAPIEFDPLLKKLAISTFLFSITFSLGLYLA